MAKYNALLIGAFVLVAAYLVFVLIRKNKAAAQSQPAIPAGGGNSQNSVDAVTNFSVPASSTYTGWQPWTATQLKNNTTIKI